MTAAETTQPPAFFDRDGVTIYNGDCRTVLASLPSESVNCCVTSPPYWGLRDYGHDGQIGLETSPGLYVAEMVAVFRELRRVLRDDGTLWLNLGDSYASGWACNRRNLEGNGSPDPSCRVNKLSDGLKEKDLVGIPWRVAFALQADGWYLRQDIIWAKPNPMPESVTDRCTKSHEYLFLMTKSPKYHCDMQAIAEPAICGANGSEFHTGKTGEHQLGRASTKPRGSGNKAKSLGTNETEDRTQGEGGVETQRGIPWEGEMRNKRSVWTVTTKPFKGAHFATFPPELIEPCIAAGCPDGGTVLDPFLGSGTTAEVARRHGCRCVGIELNAEYATMAAKRFRQRRLIAVP